MNARRSTMASSSSNNVGEDATDEELKSRVPSVEWLQSIELGYGGINNDDREAPVCFGCGTAAGGDIKLSQCAKCHVAGYCSRDCQVKDWKNGGHKHSCSSYARAGLTMTITKEEDKTDARLQVYGRIRFYACPYAVQRSSELGKGFLFVQSDCTLAELSLPIPKRCSGRPFSNIRAVLLHYLTIGEYDSEVCRDDFELVAVRGRLQETVEKYDIQSSVVLLMRFRCGHVALGVAPLVPDYGICKKLGNDYFAGSTAGALQLNLDDM